MAGGASNYETVNLGPAPMRVDGSAFHTVNFDAVPVRVVNKPNDARPNQSIVLSYFQTLFTLVRVLIHCKTSHLGVFLHSHILTLWNGLLLERRVDQLVDVISAFYCFVLISSIVFTSCYWHSWG